MAHSSPPVRNRSSKVGAGIPAQKRKPTTSRPARKMPRRRLLPRITVLAVALALLVGIIAVVRATNLNTPSNGNTATTTDASTSGTSSAPDFTLPLLSGGTFHLAGATGHPVVLYFMAPTCATCAQGSQQLAQVMQTAHVAGATALAIDVTPGDHPADLQAFAQSVGQPAETTLQWGIDPGGTIATAYGVQSLETMVVINAQGQIIAASSSPIAPAQLIPLIKRAV